MNNRIELMVDKETLGIRATSVVLSVGLVKFCGRQVVQTAHFGLDIWEQVARGRTVDKSTIDWWSTQPGGWERINVPKVTLAELTVEVREMVKDCALIWAKPAGFDLVMMRDLLGQDIWRYSKERDMSTLLGEFDPGRGTEPEFDGQRHDALADALHQHRWLCDLRDRYESLLATRRAAE